MVQLPQGKKGGHHDHGRNGWLHYSSDRARSDPATWALYNPTYSITTQMMFTTTPQGTSLRFLF